MELTRRDAAAALAAIGAGGVAAAGLSDDDDKGRGLAVDKATIRETMIAAAEVLYPNAVTGIDDFVMTFLESRLAGDTHAVGIADAVAAVNDRAESWYNDRFAALSTTDRDSLLREMAADSAEPRREGTTAEEVRYYVVNELLLALYSSPTGGELVGIENPQGHAGGIDSYQRGPQA